MSVYDLMKLAAKVGGTEKDIERVQALPVVLVAYTHGHAQAVVRDREQLLAVSVRRSLAGSCECERGARDGFCDHIAAAAMSWLSRGNA